MKMRLLRPLWESLFFMEAVLTSIRLIFSNPFAPMCSSCKTIGVKKRMRPDLETDVFGHMYWWCDCGHTKHE